MMIGCIDGFRAWLAGNRPENATSQHFKIARRQRVIDSQAGMLFRREVGRYATRITLMLDELCWMLLNRKRPPFARRCESAVYARVFQELIHRVPHAIAVNRIAIKVADDHELRNGGESAVLARIIDKVFAF